MNRILTGERSRNIGISVFAVILLISGCATFQGGKTKPATSNSCPTDSSSKVSVRGTGPAPDGSVVSNAKDQSAQNVSNSVPSSSDSTAMPSGVEIPSETVTDPNPPAATPENNITQLSPSEPGEIVRNPNQTEPSPLSEADKISPVDYRTNDASSFDKEDIPSELKTTTQNASDSLFQNASRETSPTKEGESLAPSDASNVSREIPVGRSEAPLTKSSNKVIYRTVIEE